MYDWHSVQNISTKDGLPSKFIDFLMQDSKGFMWFVTNNGLVRYDGMDMKKFLFDAIDSNSFTPDWFRGIAEDKNGIIWITSGSSGFYRLDPSTNRLSHFRNKPGNSNSLCDDETMGMVIDSSGIVWIATANGLSAYDPKKKSFRTFRHSEKDTTTVSNDFFWWICDDVNHNLWLATAVGFDCFDPQKGKVIYHINHLPLVDLSKAQDVNLTCTKGINNVVWLTCKNSGIWAYDVKQKKITAHFAREEHAPDFVGTIIVETVYQDHYGNLWVSTGQDIWIHEEATGKWFKANDLNRSSTSLHAFTSIAEDRSGKLWIASSFEGVITIDPEQKKFSVLPEKTMGENPAYMLTLLGLDDHRLMMTTEKGAFIYNEQTGSITPFKVPYKNRELTSEAFIAGSYLDNEGNLFLGTAVRLIITDTLHKSLRFFESSVFDSTSLSAQSVTGILRDHKGRYWCATFGGGLDEYFPETGKFRAYKVHEGKNSISTNTVHSVFEASDGTLYIGSLGGGLIQFYPDSEIFQVYHHVPGNAGTPSNDDSEYFCETPSGLIYFTTQGGGLNVFDPRKKQFRAFTTADGFSSNIMSGIIEDNHGTLWLGTLGGISSFVPPENPFDSHCKISIRNYNTNDGLPCNEFQFGGTWKSGKGILYFGTACGKVVYFNPDELKENKFVPPVFITGFSINNRPVIPSDTNKFLQCNSEFTKEITLSYRENVFAFSFAALNFIHPEKNLYAYMLEPFDKDWIYTNASRRFADYTNIDPGTYTFKVKGSNNDGVWNDTPAEIKLIITPPYWETWWFRGAIALAVCAFIYSLYRFRLNQLLRLQKVRNKIASDLHDDLGSTLSSISIYSEIARRQSKESIPVLDKIGESARIMTEKMSDIVWSINPDHDSFENIIQRMRAFAHDMLSTRGIEYTFEADEKLNAVKLAMEVRKNLFLFFKEAVHNLVKHSQAKHAVIRLFLDDEKIKLLIRDDGKGFDLNQSSLGNGMRTMKERAKQINATLQIESKEGEGTSVELKMKT